MRQKFKKNVKIVFKLQKASSDNKKKSIKLSIMILMMSYTPFIRTKITWTSIGKNKLQVDFSHKFSKNDFFLIGRSSNNAYFFFGLIKKSY